MKPEHFKEFNVEHAKAGAPYAQRNGLAALVGLWGGRNETYQLIGEHDTGSGSFAANTWTKKGATLATFMGRGVKHNYDLVMTPLGMCEGRPVFVGDELVLMRDVRIAHPIDRDFTDCTWPRKAPVRPTFRLMYDGLSDTEFGTQALHNRAKLEAWFKELDEYNGSSK